MFGIGKIARCLPSKTCSPETEEHHIVDDVCEMGEVTKVGHGVASEAEVLSINVTSSVEEVASEVEVLSAEVASSAEEVASEVELTSSIEEVGFKVAVL